MKFFFLLVMALFSTNVFAQDSWKICLDKETLLTTSVENAEQNTVKIKRTDLEKHKNFLINYNEAAPKKNWERTIAVYDEKDQELEKQTGKNFVLTTAQLILLFEKSKTLMFYTINLPTDPKLKSQVRVRRVHLCTLILQE